MVASPPLNNSATARSFSYSWQNAFRAAGSIQSQMRECGEDKYKSEGNCCCGLPLYLSSPSDLALIFSVISTNFPSAFDCRKTKIDPLYISDRAWASKRWHSTNRCALACIVLDGVANWCGGVAFIKNAGVLCPVVWRHFSFFTPSSSSTTSSTLATLEELGEFAASTLRCRTP